MEAGSFQTPYIGHHLSKQRLQAITRRWTTHLPHNHDTAGTQRGERRSLEDVTVPEISTQREVEPLTTKRVESESRNLWAVESLKRNRLLGVIPVSPVMIKSRVTTCQSPPKTNAIRKIKAGKKSQGERARTQRTWIRFSVSEPGEDVTASEGISTNHGAI